MILTLKPEQEQIVGEAIRTGFIATADDVVDAGVEAIRQRLRSNGASTSEIQAAADRLSRFGEKHGLSLGGMTLSDLVNEGRR